MRELKVFELVAFKILQPRVATVTEGDIVEGEAIL
jgi:hypothetical protein